MERRAVITGIGALTPLGNTFASSWDGLTRGRSGIAAHPALVARVGALRAFDPLAFVSRKDLLRYDPFALYALAAALMAQEDARLSAVANTAVIIGSGRGGIGTLEAAALGRPTAYMMAATTVGMAASLTAERTGARGPVLGISTACASGASAVAEAVMHIRSGRVDAAIAGGAEAPLCGLAIRGYSAARALSATGHSRPFDKARDGFVLAEGAAIVVVEEREAALKRGARIYAEIAGTGSSADAMHPTKPSPDGEAAAIRAALSDAGLSPDEIGFVSAHATGTPSGDQAEHEAIIGVYGQPSPPILAVKALTGHMLAASGAFELATAAYALHVSAIPSAYKPSDPAFDLTFPSSASRPAHPAATTHSFGFGGVNVAIALRK